MDVLIVRVSRHNVGWGYYIIIERLGWYGDVKEKNVIISCTHYLSKP